MHGGKYTPRTTCVLFFCFPCTIFSTVFEIVSERPMLKLTLHIVGWPTEHSSSTNAMVPQRLEDVLTA